MRAHLVGSVNLGSSAEVLGAVAEHAADAFDRIPDGETGERINWFEGQVNVLRKQPQLEGVGEVRAAEDASGEEYMVINRFKVRDGVQSSDLDFGPLGYADAAITSYHVFKRLKDAGEIPPHVQFQVSLPTPLAVAFGFMEDGHQQAFEEAYERHLIAEIQEMRKQIPDIDLAIQWDVAVEMGMLEGVFPAYVGGDLLESINERLARIGDVIPETVTLGYHLCYGNRGNEHWKEPEDTGKLAQVASGILEGCSRRVDWIHLPVPIERDDEAYFAALEHVKLRNGTELFLGLLHKEDGIDGARRRMQAARSVVSDFGVACECGMGREPSDAISGLLDLHAEVCRTA